MIICTILHKSRKSIRLRRLNFERKTTSLYFRSCNTSLQLVQASSEIFYLLDRKILLRYLDIFSRIYAFQRFYKSICIRCNVSTFNLRCHPDLYLVFRSAMMLSFLRGLSTETNDSPSFILLQVISMIYRTRASNKLLSIKHSLELTNCYYRLIFTYGF